jgi:hypothetical protein
MNYTIGIGALIVLLLKRTVMAPVLVRANISAENCSLNESVDNTLSGRMSGEFLSTFDYWATPTVHVPIQPGYRDYKAQKA